jgi:hypothetical protein
LHGVNAWHLAAMTGSVVILGKLLDWARELQLETEKFRNELLLLLLLLLLSKDEGYETV